MFKKLAYFTGWLLVLCLLLLFCFTLGLWQNWSTLDILLFWLAMLALVILMRSILQGIQNVIKGKKGHVWLAKYRLSRREFVLREHWKTGANIIRRVRRKRSPLPWFLLIGDRCGKSTLLASAGIPRFYDDTVAGLTRTLQWWFFPRIGILELSSYFLSGNETFRQGGRKLAHWCTRLPAPAGIIIALPMEKLLAGDRSVLHILARQQRSLIEPLIRRYGHRLPLYILITQCDAFPGFSLWQQQLSATQRRQPLGYRWNTPPHIDGQDVTALHPLFATLKQGMSQVRLSMATSQVLSNEQNAALLDFPESFSALEPALRYTLASLCEPNAYFSPSTLGAVWFCASEPQSGNRGRRTSIFVRDLLSKQLAGHNMQQQRWYQRSRGKKCCTAALVLAGLWLTVSSVLSLDRLHPLLLQASPDALAHFLAEDEQQPGLSLRYLPFLPLLRQQYHHAEARLVQTTGTTPRPVSSAFADYQQQVLAAEPAQQRELILGLADAILVWQQMRSGATLSTLSQVSPVTPALIQSQYSDTLAPLTVLALARYDMRSQHGERWLQTAQHLLKQLVNETLPLNWLTAPEAAVPSVSAGSFWRQLASAPALDGIWTREGQIAIDSWIARIERAVMQPQPRLQQAHSALSTLRQDAWRQFLVDTTASLSSLSPATLPRAELLALGENRSPAMRFASQILRELESIPSAEAQPWLNTLRQLHLLAKTGDSTTLLSRAELANRRLRQSLTTWLLDRPKATYDASALSTQPLWQQWQSARNRAANEAVKLGKPASTLTTGLFTPQDNGGKNPLGDMLPALNALQERLSPQNSSMDIAAVWLLYQDDARRLLANAMAQSACWLNSQWKSTVIWPLGKNTEQRSYEEQQTLSEQVISSFLQGPAKNLMRIENNGPVPAEYAGMKIPLSAAFLRLVGQGSLADLIQPLPRRAATREEDKRAALQAKINAQVTAQTSLEKKRLKTTVASLPATVPGGARVIPTGTRLTLHCLTGDQQLSSMNFAEQRDFNWQPGQCPGLTLSVIFPNFTVSYQLNGDESWPWFLNRLSSTGSALLDSRDFGESEAFLEQLGIKHILVRFTVSDSHELETIFQTWSEGVVMLEDLNTRLTNLNELDSSDVVRPLSALPTDIAQCESF